MEKLLLTAIFTLILIVPLVFAKETYNGSVIINPGENFTWTIEIGEGFKLNDNIMTPYGINLTSFSCNSHCNLTFQTSTTLQPGIYGITVLAYHEQQKSITNVKAFTLIVKVNSSNLTSYYTKEEIDEFVDLLNQTILNLTQKVDNLVTQLNQTLQEYYNKTEMDVKISDIINELNSLRSYIEANEERWSFVGGGVSLNTVRSEISKSIEDLQNLVVTKSSFEGVAKELVKLKGDIEEIKKTIGAAGNSSLCGNKICEQGESYEKCPQDCPPEIVAIPREEGIGIVGRFILANAVPIAVIILTSIILIFLYIKRLE